MGEKVGFNNCVFEKLCFFSENTIVIVFSENTTVAIQTLYVKITEILWKLWVAFEHGKKVGFVCFFRF